MVTVCGVIKYSRAARCGIKSGDKLVSINGNEISDVLDYRFYLTEETVELELLREGVPYKVRINKGEYDDIGLEFETPLMDEKHSCKNKCIFCFIDQNPEGLRETLYFKDDDSRLSFLHGNYITLTNMTAKDVARIVKMRFSPINISIHTTNPELRVKMMKNKHAGEVLSYLDDFRNAELDMCAQIVLCNGINDGEELLRTLRDLSGYYPYMKSVAIVPAGLTKFRDKLYPLQDFSRDEARAVIKMIDSVAEEHKGKFGTRLFYAADEFYLKAEMPIPESGYYEEYPQIENGVGMIRSLSDEFGMAVEDVIEFSEWDGRPRTVSIATGVASYEMIKRFSDKLMSICQGLTINVYKIVNNFFGQTITVSGLLTGFDIYDQLKDKQLGDGLLIPGNSLRHGEDVFLCGMTVPELQQKLGTPITAVDSDGYCLCEAILGRQG